MQSYFYAIADQLGMLLHSDETYTAWYEGEVSSFVRFNQGKVRQPGSVEQQYLTVDLIQGSRHAAATVTLSGDTAIDRDRLAKLVASLREKLPHVQPDPYLLYSTQIVSTEGQVTPALPEATDVTDEILEAVQGLDFVGIYASGKVSRGFANAWGQRNWFEKTSFNLDWSVYHAGDKAVKASYAGFQWDRGILENKLATCVEQLEILKRPAKTIEPGQYRVYLAPTALKEILQLLSWGGFGLKSHRTKQTPLLKMANEEACLHARVTLKENTRDGAGPNFQASGFIKPDHVDLITAGQLANTLNAPRSAKEYGVETNGANNGEFPESLEMAPGQLAIADVLPELGTGVYINNLWYLNYSDRAAARVTGMTRFATLWVEDGIVRAPVTPMRFDETLYRLLGDNLLALTQERDFILDPMTWGGRSTQSVRLPGALIDSFTFTL